MILKGRIEKWYNYSNMSICHNSEMVKTFFGVVFIYGGMVSNPYDAHCNLVIIVKWRS